MNINFIQQIKTMLQRRNNQLDEEKDILDVV
jgi:hypothetical protein